MSYILCLSIYGQKEDYNWLSGDYDANSNAKNIFKFNDLGLESIDTVVTEANFYLTNASMSDSLGNILFYTNGLKIYNAQHQVIQNGDSVNFNWWWEYLTSNNFNDYGLNQGTLILPDVHSKDSLWYLFHSRLDTISPQLFPNEYYVAISLLLTIIERNFSGQLEVRSKDEVLIGDTMFAGNLTACGHANGRDWWIFASKGKSNCIYQLLLDPNGIHIFDTVCAGMTPPIFGDIGYGTYTPDGSKYIKGSALNGFDVFDFDRCSGVLTHLESIPKASFMNPNRPVLDFVGNVVVSPNSRYLYAGPQDSLYRFDLMSSSISNSKELVYFYDTTASTPFSFVPANLGSDGVIYQPVPILGVSFYNVLLNPDEDIAGDLTFNFFIPTPRPTSHTFGNFPNYRLGPLTGSPCDTLGVGIRELGAQIELLVYPNPAHNYVEVDYGFFPWQSKSEASLSVKNMLGEEVLSLQLPQYSGKQILNIKDLATGVYFINLMDGGVVVGSEKMLIR
jgi:hypothetical protein